MMKKISILMIILISLFICAFDAVILPDPENPDEMPTEVTSENGIGTDGEEGSDNETDEQTVLQDGTNQEDIALTETVLTEEVVSETEVVNEAEQAAENTVEPEPTAEPVVQEWQGLDESQVNALYALYAAMTDNGKAASGWFSEGNYAPCTWRGISCEAGVVTVLSFENAGFFTLFPEELLAFQDLKELHMIDTLVQGPLPAALFSALPKLEVLDLQGNFLTGSIPDLPAAFVYFPMLHEITISDNLEDDRKTQLLQSPDYMNNYYFQLDPLAYPELDLTPGLDGTIPENWNMLPLLYDIDLSGNQLSGSVPENFGQIPLAKLDLRDNLEPFTISAKLYYQLVSLGRSEIILDGIKAPEIPGLVPTEEPVIIDEPVVDATATPEPGPGIFGIQMNPTEPTEPTVDPWALIAQLLTQEPTEVPSTPQTVYVVVTATPEPRFYTSTPAPRYYTATPQPYYYYPTATPYYYQQQPYYYYPTATPYYYQPQPYYYPTATPYTNYNPNWVYPTATSGYQYPQYVQNQQPTPTNTPVPTQDPAAALGFTYKLEAMAGNNIPMTWRYTGMSEYSINYLDASGNLYPAFAMEWTKAADVCNASVCNATVTVPDELLRQGKFSLQLRVRDASGKVYMSEPVMMEVSMAQPAPTPVPEQPKSFLAGFFEWLFGPLIRLFRGK